MYKVTYIESAEQAPVNRSPIGLAGTVGQASAGKVLLLVMQDVTPLAERTQIAGPVVRWVMIEVGCGQSDPGGEPWRLVIRRRRQTA